MTLTELLPKIRQLSAPEKLKLIRLLAEDLDPENSDRRRDEIAANIAQAKTEHQTGQVFRGTVAEAIAKLDR
jgi:hypothetical protein